MPEEMRIDSLGNACGACILFDDLPQAPGGVRLTAIGLKEMARAGTLLPFDILREFTAKARGKEDIPIFVPFALRDAEVTGCEIHIREAETDQFGIAYPREQEQLEHDNMRQVARLPDRLVEGDQFGRSEERRV